MTAVRAVEPRSLLALPVSFSLGYPPASSRREEQLEIVLRPPDALSQKKCPDSVGSFVPLPRTATRPRPVTCEPRVSRVSRECGREHAAGGRVASHESSRLICVRGLASAGEEGGSRGHPTRKSGIDERSNFRAWIDPVLWYAPGWMRMLDAHRKTHPRATARNSYITTYMMLNFTTHTRHMRAHGMTRPREAHMSRYLRFCTYDYEGYAFVVPRTRRDTNAKRYIGVRHTTSHINYI